MVASDFIVNRPLRWLESKEVGQLQSKFPSLLGKHHVAKIRLAPDHPGRTIGILHGSQIGRPHVVAFDLCGKMDCPSMITNSHIGVKELIMAKQMVE
jgi:hypothetical protein